MAKYEERDYRICVQMFDLPAGKSRASEANRFDSIVADSQVEVGAYYDGLCGWIAEVSGRT